MCVFSSKYLSIYLSLCFGLRGHALPQDRPEKHGHKFWSPALGELVKGPASSPCPNMSADVFYSPLRYLIYLILSYHAVGGPVFVSPNHRVGRGASYLSLIYLIAVPCQAGRPYVRRLLPLRTGAFRAPGLATALFGAKNAESPARPEGSEEAGLAPAFFTIFLTTFRTGGFLATGFLAPATRAGGFFTTVCVLTNAFFGDAVLLPLNMTGTGEAATAGRCTRSWVNAGVHAHAVANQASSRSERISDASGMRGVQFGCLPTFEMRPQTICNLRVLHAAGVCR